MNEIEIVKLTCLLFIGVLLMLVVSTFAWAKGYKDGASETRDFYIHMDLKKDDERSEKTEPQEEE